MKRIDVVGMTFGRLTVIADSPSIIISRGTPQRMVECKCSCGKACIVYVGKLRNGHTSSCGCLVAETLAKNRTTHGARKGRKTVRSYGIWCGMKRRCLDPDCEDYPRYGGRGVKIHEPWIERYEAFIADMGEPGESLTIDRIDNNGNYEPGNCRWATKLEQANNVSTNRYVTIDGETKTVAEWSRISGIKKSTIYNRLNMGKDNKDAVFSPLQ